MPYSRNQKIAAAIAEHEPGKLYKRNRGLLGMSPEQQHDFASGPLKKRGLKHALKRVKKDDIDR